MLNPLIQKLQHGADLTDEDRQVLENAASPTLGSSVRAKT